MKLRIDKQARKRFGDTMSRPRALYISGSIGLGHVSKDLAIARELRRARPDIEILWLAGHPASEVLRDASETVIPESERWIGASEIAERCTHNGQLNLVRYVYRSLPSWFLNARLFSAVVKSYDIDIAIGNEAYEVDIPLVLRILHMRVPFLMIFDFVGSEATTSNLFDHFGACILNAIWALDGRVYDGNPHSAIFIGETDEIPSRPLGWALPNRREHAQKHYDVVGHVINFRPDECADPVVWRRQSGCGDAAADCLFGRRQFNRKRFTGALRAGIPAAAAKYAGHAHGPGLWS
jgi:hypothetical protein